MKKTDVTVFASNEAGIHGAGAAKDAMKLGAVYGKSYGHYRQTFAIPTKNEFVTDPLPIEIIEYYVHGFLAYANSKRKMTFQVTRIGCGMAGFTDAQIAPLFVGAPLNCEFDEAWKPWLGDDYTYWGTK